jgi:hypothetical protein
MIYEVLFPGKERPRSPCTLIPYPPSQCCSKRGAKIHQKLQRPLESDPPKLVQWTGNFELVVGVKRVLHQSYFQKFLSRSPCLLNTAR